MNREDPLPVDPEADPDEQGRARPVPAIFAVVATGGALGTAARAALGHLFPTGDGRVPFTTLAVNLSGSFLLGLVLTGITGSGSRLRAFLVTGLLGGFTTFSTFMVETVQLGRHGHRWVAIGYLVGATLGGLLGAFAGIVTGRAVTTAVRGGRVR